MPEVVETAFDPNMNGHYENIKADNGDVYTGDWKAGKRYGTGAYTSSEGWVYTGQFQDGLKSGIGKMTYADGSSYNGEWQSDLKDGKVRG